jgi:hypothetical protein
MTDSIASIAAVGAASATDRALMEALAQIAASSMAGVASQSTSTSHSQGHHEAASSNMEHAEETGLASAAGEGSSLHSLPTALQAGVGLRMMAKEAAFSSNTSNAGVVNSGMANMETATNALSAVTIAANPKQNTETLLTPATVSQLHVTSEQPFRRLDDRPSRKDRLHRRWLSRKQADDERNQDEDLQEHQNNRNASDDSQSAALNQEPLSRRSKVVAEQSEPLFMQIVAKLQASKCEASHLALLELSRERRVLVAFPAEDNHSLQSVADAYLLWQKGDKGKVARIHARLYWANTKRDRRLISVRVRKDCDEAGQRILKPEIEETINPEGTAILSIQSLAQVRWTQAALVVTEAVRLWSLVGQQWSMRVVIATAPLYDFPGAH